MSSGDALVGLNPSVDTSGEYVPDLLWPQSVDTYTRMRHDPTIASILAAYVRPIVSARWSIDARGASPAMAQLCADSLGLPLLGADDPGKWRRRGVRWLDHVKLAVPTLLTYGHAPYEPVYDVTSGQAVLSSLGERLPSSIDIIETDREGNLKKVTQKAWNAVLGTDIPADRLLWYVRQREGAAWQGISLLRHAFGPWLIKQDLLRVQGTGLRRFAAGTPTLEQLPGTTPTQAQITAAQAAVQAIRVGETGGLTAPGFRLRIVGVEGTVPDALPTIHYLDQQMARGALESVLDLANTGTGNRALGSVFADLLAQAVEATAREFADTATDLCVRLVDFNEGGDADVPAVHVDMSASRAAIAEALGNLVQSGALEMDDDLQAWMRDALSLPEPKPRPKPSVPPAPGPTPTPGAGPDDQEEQDDDEVDSGRPVTAAARTYRRALTAREQQAQFDPAAVDVAHDQVLADLLEAWPAVTQAWTDEITAQVEDAVSSGDLLLALTILAALRVDTTTAADTLAVAMSEAADLGVGLAAAETTGQGVTAPAVDSDETSVTAMATAIAAVMGASFAAAASREAVRLVGTSGAAPDDLAARVGEFLAALSGTYAHDVLGGAVADAINAGRARLFAAAATVTELEVTYVASEVRDSSTCPPCRAVDGTEWADLDDALAAYPTGGYGACQGRERCRGLLLAVFE
jgi:hypothetical protein